MEMYLHTVKMPFAAVLFKLSAPDFAFALVGALPVVNAMDENLRTYVPTTDLMMPCSASPRAFIPGPSGVRYAPALTEQEGTYQFSFPVQSVVVATTSTLQPALVAEQVLLVNGFQQLFGDNGISGYTLFLSDNSTATVKYNGPAGGASWNPNGSLWPTILPPNWSV